MPDDVFIKLPKFGKINFGIAKVHYCPNLYFLPHFNGFKIKMKIKLYFSRHRKQVYNALFLNGLVTGAIFSLTDILGLLNF